MTKRELLDLLEDHPDEITVELGPLNGEPGTERPIHNIVYATGNGIHPHGGCSLIIEYDLEETPDRDVEEEKEDELSCPFCGAEITKCPHCGEDL